MPAYYKGQPVFGIMGNVQFNVWWSPKMTGAESPSPYKVTASGVINQTAPYPWTAFSGKEYPAQVGSTWMVWFSPNSPSWISFDFSARTRIKGMRLLPCADGTRYTVEYRSYFPRVFNIEGSYDGESWIEIFSADGDKEYDPQNGEYMECLFSKTVDYSYYRINTQTNYASTGNDKIALIQNIMFLRPAGDIG